MTPDRAPSGVAAVSAFAVLAVAGALVSCEEAYHPTLRSSAAAGGAVSAADATPLPIPPGRSGIPKPSGAPGGLKVLDWAGFKSAVTFTFDDSQPSQIEHYAELAAAGVPMTFYISTGTRAEDHFDRTWTQAVKDGSEIGNHTVHHCHADLTGCAFGAHFASLLEELDGCSTYVTEHYGQQGVWTGASPYGDTGYDRAASTRFFLYRGVGSGTIRPNDATDPFNLPCDVATTGETEAMFDQLVDAARAGGAWQIVLIHTIQPTSAVWYNPVNLTDITGSMSHAKSLGDVWVDTVANVGAYWAGQKAFAAAAPVTSANVTTWTWTLPAHFPPGKALRVTAAGGTLTQGGRALGWDEHGYYEVSLDPGTLTLTQ